METKSLETGRYRHTTALKIAALLAGDGQRFEADDGQSLEDLAVEAGARVERAHSVWDDESQAYVAVPDPDGELVRSAFPDGSAILASGDIWDVECPGRPWISESASWSAIRLVRTERLTRDTVALRRFLFREDGEVYLAVDRMGVTDTPAGTHDGCRDSDARPVRHIYAGPRQELDAELERLGGEYNPPGPTGW